MGLISTMRRKSISWKLDLLTTMLYRFDCTLLVAVFVSCVLCCGVCECQGQPPIPDARTIAGLAAAGQTDGPEDSDASLRQFAEFERQLNAILKTRRVEEKEFVGSVVEQIRVGALPSKLVTTSFEWVRNKRPTTKYPFVYFERVLRLQAGRLGLGSQVPPFNFAVYSELPLPPTTSDNPVGETPGNDATVTERNSSFPFQSDSSLTADRFGPVGGGQEASLSDGAETERGSNIFQIGRLLLDRIRRQ